MLLVSRLVKKLQSWRDGIRIKKQATPYEAERNLQQELQNDQLAQDLPVTLHELRLAQDLPVTLHELQSRRDEEQLMEQAKPHEAERNLQQESQNGHQAQDLPVTLHEMHSRRDETRIKEQAKAKAREIERNLQQETRNHQRTQALLAALHELQQKMDPLIAAQVYNDQFCPLSRLPEELLLEILEFLCDDPVTLHCIRIVSRTFRRLLISKGNPQDLKCTTKLQLRRLLQRDGRCENCRRWNASHGKLYDACKFEQQDRQSSRGLAKHQLHCDACSSLHDVSQFSFSDQNPCKTQGERRCLGQQGSVELCEHIQIYWSSIKAHIDNWRQQQQHEGGDWQSCLDSFKIECHDAIHDTRCTTLERPTRPRARLNISTFDSSVVVLHLEWLTHNRIDALNLTADGRIPATGLTAMFQQVRRRGPADILCPPCRPDAPPEMALFGPSSRVGRLISYNIGEEDETGIPSTATFPSILRGSVLQFFRGRPAGANGTLLVIRPHFLGDADRLDFFPGDANDSGICSMCLMVGYRKEIMICEKAAMTDTSVSIVPAHHWLHAMDIRTYPHPKADDIRPPCMDLSCVNYYRGRRPYYFCPTY